MKEVKATCCSLYSLFMAHNIIDYRYRGGCTMMMNLACQPSPLPFSLGSNSPGLDLLDKVGGEEAGGAVGGSLPPAAGVGLVDDVDDLALGEAQIALVLTSVVYITSTSTSVR
jgi:hypothetical protein